MTLFVLRALRDSSDDVLVPNVYLQLPLSVPNNWASLFSFLFFSPEYCPLLYRTHLFGHSIRTLLSFFFFHRYHDIVFYFLRLLVTIRANFLQAQWRPNNCSSLMRRSPFRDAYLRSSQNRNCTGTEVRCSSPTHIPRKNVTPVSSQIHYWQGMASPSL